VWLWAIYWLTLYLSSLILPSRFEVISSSKNGLSIQWHNNRYKWARLEVGKVWAHVGKVWGSCRLPGDGPDHPHLAGNHLCPPPLRSLLCGNLLWLPSREVGWVLKAPEKEKHALSAGGLHLRTLYPLLFLPFPHVAEQVTPLFSIKLSYLTPSMCSAWVFPFGVQKPGSSDQRRTSAININYWER
jgi:hypothetical protein